MFRKVICVLMAVLFCLGAFAGCSEKKSKSEQVVGQAAIKRDVAESTEWQRYDAEIVSCEVTRRQTNPEDKTDYVFVKVFGESDRFGIEAYYKLTYVFYNEGWLLEDLIPDPKEDVPVLTWQKTACIRFGASGDRFAILGPDGVVLNDDAARPDRLPVIEGAEVSSAVRGQRIVLKDRSQSDVLFRLLETLFENGITELTPQIVRIDLGDPEHVGMYFADESVTIRFADAKALYGNGMLRLRNNWTELMETADTMILHSATSVTISVLSNGGIFITPVYPDSVQPDEPVASPDPSGESTDTRTAIIQDEKGENNEDLVSITVVVPAKSKLTIHFPNQEDYQYENEDDKDKQRKVKIPVQIFYKNEPLEESTVEFFPEITITSPDGSSYKVNCPSFTRTFPKLNITLTAPVPDDDNIIMAPESNEIKISGTIDEPTADVSVNGNPVPIDAGGMFVYDFKFPADAGEEDVETLKIVATKDNYVTDEEEITIHAYKFIPEPMKLEVHSEGSALRADASGKLTVTGKTTPGAELTATSDDPQNVSCGKVSVDGSGNFSFQITMGAEYYGASVITLRAEKENMEPAQRRFRIIKGFKDKDAFLKYYNKTKTYMEIAPKKLSIDDLLANQTQYASNTYGFRIIIVVVEVIDKDGDIIVKATNNKTGETVYVHNLSEKWAPADNIGAKYYVYCNFVGTYEDTGCCEFLGWFAKKP
ncbi:MAG: hypothetical protein II117_03725 [Clostridia bacterium]|nr:hypothetical protein [Clostridia bacterium]